jgi:hypothetical protein
LNLPQKQILQEMPPIEKDGEKIHISGKLFTEKEFAAIKERTSALAKKSEMSSMEEETYGSITKCSPYPMSISGIPYGNAGWSSEARFDFTSIPAGATNVLYELTCSTTSGVGTFRVLALDIICGNYEGLFEWDGNFWDVSTDAFYGTPANVWCYTSFGGQCIGTGYAPPGSGPVPCSLTMSGCCMTNYYQY